MPLDASEVSIHYNARVSVMIEMTREILKSLTFQPIEACRKAMESQKDPYSIGPLSDCMLDAAYNCPIPEAFELASMPNYRIQEFIVRSKNARTDFDGFQYDSALRDLLQRAEREIPTPMFESLCDGLLMQNAALVRMASYIPGGIMPYMEAAAENAAGNVTGLLRENLGSFWSGTFARSMRRVAQDYILRFLLRVYLAAGPTATCLPTVSGVLQRLELLAESVPLKKKAVDDLSGAISKPPFQPPPQDSTYFAKPGAFTAGASTLTPEKLGAYERAVDARLAVMKTLDERTLQQQAAEIRTRSRAKSGEASADVIARGMPSEQALRMMYEESLRLGRQGGLSPQARPAAKPAAKPVVAKPADLDAEPAPRKFTWDDED